MRSVLAVCVLVVIGALVSESLAVPTIKDLCNNAETYERVSHLCAVSFFYYIYIILD